jgi:ABC-type multidrug transport system permease subunit
MIDTTLAVLKKNMQVLLRRRSSTILLVLGPVLLILLAGLAFNHSDPYAIRVGVFSEDYSDLSDKLVSKLDDQLYDVQKYERLEDCHKDIRQAKTHLCMELSPQFAFDDPDRNNIGVTVDFSKLNIVDNVLNDFSSTVDVETGEIRAQLANTLITAVDIGRKQVEKDKPVLVGLTTNAEELKGKIETLRTNLGAIDLSGSTTGNPQAELGASEKILSALVEDLRRDTDTLMNSSFSAIDQAIEGTEGDLQNDLQDIREDLVDLNTSVLRDHNSVVSEVSNMKSASIKVTTSITELQAKMNKAKNSQDGVSGELVQVVSILDSTLQLIVKLQDSVNTLGGTYAGVRITDAAVVVDPFNSVIEPIAPKTNYLEYLFPTLLLMLCMIGSLLVAPSLIHADKQSSAHIRNLLAKEHKDSFYLGTLITSSGVVISQLLLVLVISTILFGSGTITGVMGAFGVLIVATIGLVGIGLSIGYLFFSETAALLSSAVLSILLILTSDIVIPGRSLPGFIGQLFSYNPLNLAEIALRNTLLYGSGFAEILPSVMLLTVFSVAMVGISYFCFNRQQRY